ncbi:hypothetical protein ACQ4PT_043777 [Festuca glaucescens]
MNMFRSLNPRYFYAIPILTMQLPFPSFLRCRAFLILEESRLSMAAAPPSDVALHASRAPTTGNNTSAPTNVTNTRGALATATATAAEAKGRPCEPLDQAALVQALNSMSIQQQQAPPAPTGEWYLDTGASSHMSNNPGSSNQDGDPPIHFSWTFPLRYKSDALAAIQRFYNLAHTHFNLQVLTLQADNGREFDNRAARAFFDSCGTALRMSCPYTSAQNGRAERMLRTLNESMRALLVHASMPPHFWAEALSMATFLLNRRPCRARQFLTPFELLYCATPDYSAIRVFGCLCYPNTTATAPHKLAPRSVPCVFLGYSPEHKGYRCLNRATGRALISRHVFFDEAQFPFAAPVPTCTSSPSPPDDDHVAAPFPAMPPPASHPCPLTTIARAAPATPLPPPALATPFTSPVNLGLSPAPSSSARGSSVTPVTSSPVHSA